MSKGEQEKKKEVFNRERINQKGGIYLAVSEACVIWYHSDFLKTLN